MATLGGCLGIRDARPRGLFHSARGRSHVQGWRCTNDSDRIGSHNEQGCWRLYRLTDEVAQALGK